MSYISWYLSPMGRILLAADEVGISGLWFEGQKYFASGLGQDYNEEESPLLLDAKRWLDRYFAGERPPKQPTLHPIGTKFQLAVWEQLGTIPYGQTTTYKAIAQRLAQQKGLPHMSAQAVGNAVGHNRISILIPCHRVLGSDGALTGYAGGLDRKRKLLALEQSR